MMSISGPAGQLHANTCDDEATISGFQQAFSSGSCHSSKPGGTDTSSSPSPLLRLLTSRLPRISWIRAAAPS